jgi:hypothetical protein
MGFAISRTYTTNASFVDNYEYHRLSISNSDTHAHITISRTEKAFVNAIIDPYLQGISTRNIEKVRHIVLILQQ